MKLIRLEQAQNTVAAICSDRNECETLDFLHAVPTNMTSHARGMRVLFERYAKGGRALLTKELFHEADSAAGIWEFRKGRLRVFCFMDGGSLIIATHGIVKKTQKADRAAVALASSLRDQYLRDKQLQCVVWEDSHK